MPAQNKTTLLRLNQWLENEYPKMADFNEDNLAVENAIKEIKNSLSNLNYVDSVTLSGNEIVIVKKGVTSTIPLPRGFSGSWNDLTNKPDVEVANWNKVISKPSVFPTNWSNVQGKPDNYPTTWEEVKNKPNIAMIDNLNETKNDLQNKLNTKMDKIIGLSSKDLNTIYEVGFYSCSSCSNKPSSSGSYGSLIVLKADNNRTSNATTDTVQIYIDNSSKIFVRDCIDKNNSWDSWNELATTSVTGNVLNLRTNNKNSLVDAINEVFQLGTSKAEVIKSKVSALIDKSFSNLGNLATELEKYDVESKMVPSFVYDVNFTDSINFIYDNYLYCSKYDVGCVNLETLNKVPAGNNFNFNNIIFQSKKGPYESRYTLIDIKSNFKKEYNISDFGYSYNESANFLKINNKLYIAVIKNNNVEIYNITDKRKQILSGVRNVVGSYGNKIVMSSPNKLHIYNTNFQKERSITISDNETGIFHYVIAVLKDVVIVVNQAKIDVYSLSNGNKIRTHSFSDNQFNFTFYYEYMKPLLGQLSLEECYFIKDNRIQNNTKYHDVYRIDNSGNLHLHTKFFKNSNEIHNYISLDGKYLLAGGYRDKDSIVYKLEKFLKKVR